MVGFSRWEKLVVCGDGHCSGAVSSLVAGMVKSD